MPRFSFRSILISILVLSVAGCSSAGSPVMPNPGPDPAAQTTVSNSAHRLWSYNLVYVDPSTMKFKVVPLREASIHLNVLSWLQDSPCGNCFKIVQILPSGTGTILVRVQIKHPYVSANLTGFDVRGIVMFNASHKFPTSGLTLSDRAMGDQVVVNPDGYTSLYNPSTVGKGMEGYIKGNLAPNQFPSGTLNAYKWFSSNEPENIRNAFYAGDSVMVTYELSIPPGPFAFGYAVDACWAQPINKPVKDPMTDFGPEANCPEAWKINVQGLSTMTDCQGKMQLQIDVFDYQGADNTYPPMIECPEVFKGAVPAVWTLDGAGFSRYEATIYNDNWVGPGTYTALISKQAKENDPVNKPWLNLTSYTLFTVQVVKDKKQPPTASLVPGKLTAVPGESISFDASGSHDNDCGGWSIKHYEYDWENDGNWVEGPVETSHAWDTEGIHQVDLSVIDDEGVSVHLQSPISITVSQQPFKPVDLTPPWLNFSPQDVCVDGNRMYVAGGDFGMHIFDISNPTNPTWQGWVKEINCQKIAASGNYVYTCGQDSAFRIIDVSIPLFAHVVKTVSQVGEKSGHGCQWRICLPYAYVYQ